MRRRSTPLAVVALFLIFASLIASALAAPTGRWVEARSANFIVVSNAGEGQARKIALQFEQIRSLFRDSLSYAKAGPSPVITILAVKDEDSLRELLPEYWAEKGHTHPAGIFVDRYYQLQVALNLNAHGDNPYEALYHEYYHSVTVPFFPGLPTWIAEGMADFWGNSVINDKTANLGMPNGALIQELRSKPLIPLSVLFKVDNTSPYYNEQDKVSIFYAESWALVHYLMLGDNRVHNAALGTYLGALNQGATQDEAAAKAFGNLQKLEEKLEQYIAQPLFPAIQVAAPTKSNEDELAVRTISPAEVDAYCGGFLALHGQFQQAEPLLKHAVQADPRLALAQRNLALLHYFRKENSDALASVSAAIALDSQEPMARFLRAEWTFENASRTDPQIEADLHQALQSKADFPEANGLLAIYYANNSKLPEALAFSQKAVAFEPGNINFRIILANVLLNMHRYDDAEAQAHQIAAATADNGVRTQANDILTHIAEARNYEAQARQRQQEAAARASAAAAARASVPAAQSNVVSSEKTPDPRDDADAPEFNRRDAPPNVRGVVAQVRCNGNEMEVTVKTGAQPAPLIFRALDRTRIGYSSNTAAVHDDIEPCTELKGRTVRVDYKPSATKFFDGEVVQITVEK
jgi:hypothetical protein